MAGLPRSIASRACDRGGSRVVELVAKGISFGSLTVTRTGTDPCVTTIDTGAVVGVDADLVVAWGTDLVTTNVHFWVKVEEARRRGIPRNFEILANTGTGAIITGLRINPTLMPRVKRELGVDDTPFNT